MRFFINSFPDYPTILAVGVPDLGAVHPTAVPADDLPRKWGEAVMPPSQFLPPGNLHLNCFPFGRIDDGLVAAFHIALGYFYLVNLHHCCKNRLAGIC